MPETRPQTRTLPYTERERRKGRLTAMLIAGLFVLTIVVFAMLLGAGTLIHGS